MNTPLFSQTSTHVSFGFVRCRNTPEITDIRCRPAAPFQPPPLMGLHLAPRGWGGWTDARRCWRHNTLQTDARRCVHRTLLGNRQASPSEVRIHRAKLTILRTSAARKSHTFCATNVTTFLQSFRWRQFARFASIKIHFERFVGQIRIAHSC